MPNGLRLLRLLLLVLVSALGHPTTLGAQEPYAPETVTAQDYARAQEFLGADLSSLVYGTGIRPAWLPDGRFWYRTATPRGQEFIMVDPQGGTRALAFDHERLAQALSNASGEVIQPYDLPFSTFETEAEGNVIGFDEGTRTYRCDLVRYECSWERRTATPGSPGRGGPAFGGRSPEVVSPDGSRAVFIREHNLWMRDTASGEETQLTMDGVEDFGYGTNNAGWTRSDRPVVLWSPDSRMIATFQHDARGVGMMYLTSTGVGHPELEAWRYPLPEDSVIFRIQRVVIHVADPTGPRVVRLDMPPDQHRSTICDHIYCNGVFADVEWAPDGSQLAFVSSSRDHKEARLRVADPETGEVRDVLEERVATYFESGEDMVNWHFFPEYDEVLWFSERTNWGHLYLYDLASGALEHPVTSGDWRVLQVRHIDRENRTIYFTGSGREPGDPYFQYFYSVGMDGGDVRLLTPDSANHDITIAPDNKSFIDAASTPLDPGTTVLRDMEGTVILPLEAGDISRLEEAGWQPPIPFTVKARDGTTDLYGIMFKPSHLDPSLKYPVVNYLYPGPQSGSVGSRSFSAARREHQAMAELGFVVVTVDAMGTPGRSKSFHDVYYGNMGDNGLPDQITTIQQLAARHPWMDLDRVGIWGHSGGGFASTAGILRYPDFYKVAVSQAGNHDNRNYEDDWGEKWQGLLETYPDGTTSYDNQANQLVAGNLKGKLLLAHGTMDNNVPPTNTMVVVNALIEANKDFDLILFPNRRHGFGNEPYMMRRRWDYLVKNLLGAEPPTEYDMGGR